MADYDLYDGTPPHEAESDTSKAAAESMKPTAASIRSRVLAELKKRGEEGATDEELQSTLGLKAQTESPRRRELVLGGKVVDSGRRRQTSSGRTAVVWVVEDVPVEIKLKRTPLSVQVEKAWGEIEGLKAVIRRQEEEIKQLRGLHVKKAPCDLEW